MELNPTSSASGIAPNFTGSEAIDNSEKLTAPFNEKPWHELWNPLGLSATASPAGFVQKFMLFVYFFKSAISDKVMACLPLLVLFGEPGKPGPGATQGTGFYVGLCVAIAFWAFMITLLHFGRLLETKSVTFFKVTLYCEWLRESRKWKVISLVLILWFFVFLAIIWAGAQLKLQSCGSNITCFNEVSDVAGIDPTAPRPWKVAFVLLVLVFFKELYSILTYNDAYDNLMLPPWDFVEKNYPDAFKTAKLRDIFPGRLAEIIYSFAPYQFEPNLDVKPDGLFWILTDSAIHLRSVMMICGFISAQMKKRPYDEAKTVQQFREANMKDDPKLQDGSLPFE
jgi:hypothetical protein